MTQDEKSILLKDLCARLPYRVKCFVPIENLTMELTGKRLNYFCFHKEEWGFDYSHEFEVVLDPLNDARNGYVIKPYLRSISSMTEEEKEELKQISNDYLDEWENTKTSLERWKLDAKVSYKRAVFYNSHHLDWNGLIELGLSLESPEGMYLKWSNLTTLENTKENDYDPTRIN